MDSRLDQIFRTSFRQTESADTWMGIRREEPQDQHGRKKKNDEDKDKPAWEDETVVSIAALKQFLTSLIAPASPFMPPPVASAAASHGPPPLSVQQQQAHHAAQAYQNTARHAPVPVIPPPSEPPRTEPPSSSPTLSTEENRTIHQVLDLLDQLLASGVSTLTIQKEGSFLESLKRSAETALNGPSS